MRVFQPFHPRRSGRGKSSGLKINKFPIYPLPLVILMAAFTLPIASLSAAEKGVLESGPSQGTASTPVMAYSPVGQRAGEEFDAVAAIGDGPGALLFIHEMTRNALPVIRAIDQAGQEFSLLGLHTATLLLSDDRTAAETKLKAVNGSLKLKNPIVLSLDGADGPGNYALNRKAVLTLIVLNAGKVIRSAAFTDVNQKDSVTVRDWIAEVTGPLPDNPKKLRALAATSLPENGDALRVLATDQAVEMHRLRGEVVRLKQKLADARYAGRGMTMRGGDKGSEGKAMKGTEQTEPKAPAKSAKREGASPSDTELSDLLRSFIRKTNDKAANDTTFTSIKTRAATNDDLHTQTVEMFKLMLSFRDRYGTDYAQGLAESFLKAANTTGKMK